MTEFFSHKPEEEVTSTSPESHDGLVDKLIKLEQSNKRMPIDVTDVVSQYASSMTIEKINETLSLCGNIKIIAADNGARFLLTHKS